jgi:pimeloyl-ACP methyl ester carboxylesterase
VTAEVDGRTLSGHCRGEQRDAPAVVLESGDGANQAQLAGIEELLTPRTLVCAYDRAGIGRSDPPAETPRPVSELMADLDAFATAAKVPEPYVLVGQSAGGNVVLTHAQLHPEKVAGFVAMNPWPPVETFLPAVKEVATEEGYAAEVAFYRGQNDEGISFAKPVLDTRLPPTMPFTIMYDVNCGGDPHCDRVLPAITQSTRALARLGEGGRFVRAEGTGQEIYRDPELVHRTVDEILRG